MPFQGPSSDSAQAGDIEDEAGIFAEINITPLTDVILVLLIIFMVSSSAMVDAMRDGRLDVALPKAGAAQRPAAQDTTLVVGVASDGRIFVHGKFVSSDELDVTLAKQHESAPDTVVIVDADGHLTHRDVVTVIDRVRAAGFKMVGIGAESS